MANLKQFFDEAGRALTYEELEAAIRGSGSKFVDLTEGNYVAKNKYDNELQTLNSQIETLNGTIGTRDTDLATLKAKLEAAGADSEKIASLTKDLEALQGKYNEDTKAYEDRLKKQSYEFAVKEFASGLNFSSKAAQREFVKAMCDANLKMKGDEISGADIFLNDYYEENSDSFVTDYEDSEYYDDDDYEEDYKPEYQPQFVAPTPGGEPTQDATQAFIDAFNFVPVRPVPDGK